MVIRRQDAKAVARVAQQKKASEDKTFELMDSDLPAYSAKHIQSTAKRMEGKNVVTLDSYSRMYHL